MASLKTGTDPSTITLLIRRASGTCSAKTVATTLGCKPLAGQTASPFGLLDTTPDHGSFSGLTGHIFRIIVPGFLDQLVGLIHALLGKRCIKALCPSKLGLLCPSDCTSGRPDKSSRKKGRGNDPHTTSSTTSRSSSATTNTDSPKRSTDTGTDITYPLLEYVAHLRRGT